MTRTLLLAVRRGIVNDFRETVLVIAAVLFLLSMMWTAWRKR